MIRLRFGHLCDYATTGQNGKLMLVGIFDNMFVGAPGMVALPTFFLVLGLECSVADGSQHIIGVRLVDGDGVGVIEGIHHPAPQQFTASAPGQPFRIQSIVQMAGLAVPAVGDYEFQIRVDQQHVGDIPLAVLPAPRAAVNG